MAENGDKEQASDLDTKICQQVEVSLWSIRYSEKLLVSIVFCRGDLVYRFRMRTVCCFVLCPALCTWVTCVLLSL